MKNKDAIETLKYLKGLVPELTEAAIIAGEIPDIDETIHGLTQEQESVDVEKIKHNMLKEFGGNGHVGTGQLEDMEWVIDHLSEKGYLGAPDEVRKMYDMIDFFWRWVERAYFDKDLSVNECLGMLVHSPYAPWNNDREKWDTKHKEYDAEIDRVCAEVQEEMLTPLIKQASGIINE